MQFSTFRLSAESFWAVLFGDEVLDIYDYILPEDYDHTQYSIFLMSRILVAIFGLVFPFLILPVLIAIVSTEVEQKVRTQQHRYMKHQLLQDNSIHMYIPVHKFLCMHACMVTYVHNYNAQFQLLDYICIIYTYISTYIHLYSSL